MKTMLFFLTTTILFFIIPIRSHAQMAVTAKSFDDLVQRETGAIPKVNAIYRVTDFVVNGIIENQIANVSVSQTIQNVSGRELEIEMLFPLPAKGVVQDFVLMVDGTEIRGKLLDKTEARSIYEEIVRRKKDPALMEYAGYGLYKTSVFPVPAGKSRTISLKYTMHCEQRLGNTTFIYPFSTQKFSNQSIGKVKIAITIKDDKEIRNVYSPSHNVLVDKTDPKRVVIGYEANNVIPEQDFKLFFHPTNSDVGISMLSYKPSDSDEGWFMLLASPSIKNKNTQRIAKNVIIAIDISGSMNGIKIEQAKKAASFIINNLNEDDMFNIVTYQGIVEVYSSAMLPSTHDNVKNALSFITNLSAGGGTNINEALQRAMGITGDTERPGYLLFLTDGLPTVGETNEMNIARNCLLANKNKTRVFSFGVGYDVNARLLERISEQNSGMSAYVKPGENLEIILSEFYRSIQSPVLTDITVAFAVNGNKDYEGSFAVFKAIPDMATTFSANGIKEVYPASIPDMFEGSQIELFGKYLLPGKTKVTITGFANGKKQTYSYDVEFADKGEGIEYKQIEKIWATRKIGFLINQIDLNGEKEELVTSLVELSKKYGILTPYTSFLAREDIDIYDVRQNTTTTTMNLEKLDNVSGQSGVAQRSYKQQLKNERVATENEDVMSVTAAGEVHTASTVKNIGGRPFYLRNGIWVDGTLNEAQEKNAVTVKQFSDKYFEIAKNNSVDLNQYLSVDEEIVINLNGDAYKIVK